MKKRIIIIVLVILVLSTLVSSTLAIYFYYYDDFECNDTNKLVTLDNENDIETLDIDTFKVEIKGEVLYPGVYEVTSDMVVNDLILTAGGLNDNAYTNNINLSHSLSKEMVVYVYSKNLFINEDKNVSDNECVSFNQDISSCVENKESIIVSSSDENVNNINEVSSLININTASIDELMTLSGIGESKANNIISYRNEHGNFNAIEEIKNVNGIGDAIYEKIKDYITI